MRLALETGNLRLFGFGIALATAIGIGLMIVSITHPPLFFKVTATVAAGLAAGRIAAILAGLELNLNSGLICLLLFTVNLAWLCTLLPVFIKFLDDLGSVRFLGSFLRNTRERAEAERSRMVDWGPWALPVFVWLPFPFTGSFVAAVIGHLMGMPMKRLLVMVISSMFAGIVSWTYGVDYLMFLTGSTGRLIAYSLLAAVLIHTFSKRKRLSARETTPQSPVGRSEESGP